VQIYLKPPWRKNIGEMADLMSQLRGNFNNILKIGMDQIMPR
jgi:hypothetical protein